MNYRETYTRAFSDPNYNWMGCSNVHDALVYIESHASDIKSHVDIGTGRGAILQYLRAEGFCRQNMSGIKSTSVDLQRFHEFDNVAFVPADLSNPEDLAKLASMSFDVLTCLDVLEHLEAECIDAVLRTFAAMSKMSLITIACHEDVVDGVRLHLSVEPKEWWEEKLTRYFKISRLREITAGRLYYYESEPKQ